MQIILLKSDLGHEFIIVTCRTVPFALVTVAEVALPLRFGANFRAVRGAIIPAWTSSGIIEYYHRVSLKDVGTV